jgi:hypothetical protein
VISFRRRASVVLLALAFGCAAPAEIPGVGPGSFGRDVLDPGASGEHALGRLAADFYGRLVKRRFNSIATYQDPALREYFRTIESFSDYYADLAQNLADQHFEANRPTAVEIQSITWDDPAKARVTVRFVGENGLPLRWWSTSFDRVDQWERVDERWWITPGKL